MKKIVRTVSLVVLSLVLYAVIGGAVSCWTKSNCSADKNECAAWEFMSALVWPLAVPANIAVDMHDAMCGCEDCQNDLD